MLRCASFACFGALLISLVQAVPVFGEQAITNSNFHPNFPFRNTKLKHSIFLCLFVAVMLPLDTVTLDGELKNADELRQTFAKLREADVDGSVHFFL
jgi:hypothetical protein